MIRLRHKLFLHVLRVLDLLVLSAALFLVVWLLTEGGGRSFLEHLWSRTYSLRDVAAAAALLFVWWMILGHYVRYEANRFSSFLNQIRGIVLACTFATLLVVFVAALGGFQRVDVAVAASFWALTAVVLILSRMVLFRLLLRVRRVGRNSRHILVVGVNSAAVRLAGSIEQRPELGCRIIGFVAEDIAAFERALNQPLSWPLLGTMEDIRNFLEKGSIDEVLACLPLKEHVFHVYDLIRLCRDLGLVVRVVPEAIDTKLLSQAQVELFEGHHLITFFRENLLWQLLAKRVVDTVVSASMLLVLSPLLLVVALIIKFTSPGPVLFVQERVGMNKRKFNLLKFRSMVANAEALKQQLVAQNEMDGPVFKMKNDPRITPIGRFIRKTSIDELPQLWNVLRGDMSLVGPRPPLPNEVAQYELLSHRRLSIRPGLTCIWQISGRNEVSFQQWMEMDREYVENWTFWLDLKILAQTVPVVLFGKGAS